MPDASHVADVVLLRGIIHTLIAFGNCHVRHFHACASRRRDINSDTLDTWLNDVISRVAARAPSLRHVSGKHGRFPRCTDTDESSLPVVNAHWMQAQRHDGMRKQGPKATSESGY